MFLLNTIELIFVTFLLSQEKQTQAEQKRNKKRAKAFVPPKEKLHAPSVPEKGSFS